MTAHHDWCEPDRCSVGAQPQALSSGAHKGHVTPVLRGDGSTIATVWVEQVNGCPARLALAHTPGPRWTADEARAVADALTDVAEALEGLR